MESDATCCLNSNLHACVSQQVYYAALAPLQCAGRRREDRLTVKNSIIVLEVLPLLVPLGVLVENDTHRFSVPQNTHARMRKVCIKKSTAEMDIQRSAEGSSETRGKKKKRASVSLTHWLQTLWSRCRLLWRRIRSVSSAEKEPCKDRRHPHLSPSSWSPHSEEMRYRFIVTWLEQDTSRNGTVHYLPGGILLETLS